MRIDSLKKIPVDSILPPYGKNITDSIIHMDSARLCATLKLSGIPFEAVSDSTLEQAFATVSNLLVGLAKDFGGRLAVWTHLIKRNIKLDESYSFDNDFFQSFADKYVERFSNSTFFETSYYMTFVLKYRDVKDSIAEMDKILSMAKVALSSFEVTVLAVEENLDGSISCRNNEFLAYLFNNAQERIPLSASSAVDTIVNSTWYFGYDVLEVHNKNEMSKKNAVLFLLRDYPAMTECGMWDFLLKEQHEFIISQSMVLMNNSSAIKLIDKQLNKLASTGDAAEQQADELAYGRAYLTSGDIAFGDYQATLMVFGSSAKQAVENGMNVSSQFFSSGKGARWVRCNTDAIFAFSSIFPGSANRPLSSPRSTNNIASSFSLHNYSLGKKSGNPIGDGSALMPLRTKAGGLHYFNGHHSNPNENVLGEKIAGHVLLLGATGTGKTTTQCTISLFGQRFNGLMFVLDYQRSMELFILASGGSYFSIKEGEKTGLNPFQLGDKEDKTLVSFLYRLVERCAAEHDGTISVQDENIIKAAVDSVMDTQSENRRFSYLLQFINKGTALRDRLERWCEYGSNGIGKYAWALDAEVNTFNPIEHTKIGFDMTALLATDGVHPVMEPMFSVLLFMKNMMQRDGKTMATIIEEFWKPVSYPLPAALIKDVLKSGRLKGEYIYLISQSPEDAINIPLFPAIVQQTPTKVLLPNPDAEYESYKKIGCTEKEFNELKKLYKDSRTFLIKQSNTSCFAELNLYGFDDYLPIISGTWENVALRNEIVQEIGSDAPDKWIPVLQQRIRERKLHAANKKQQATIE